MTKNNEMRIINNNVAIVQSPEYSSPSPAMLTVEDLKDYFGTIYLKVAESMPIAGDEFTSIRSLFGAWVESGNEDQQLEELYKSRLNPSVSVSE